jgi:hypothetical protein
MSLRKAIINLGFIRTVGKPASKATRILCRLFFSYIIPDKQSYTTQGSRCPTVLAPLVDYLHAHIDFNNRIK